MLRYEEIRNAMKSYRIAGRRSSGHYDHDDTYHIGPHSVYTGRDVTSSTETASAEFVSSEDEPSALYEAYVDPRTGEQLYRPVTPQE